MSKPVRLRPSFLSCKVRPLWVGLFASLVMTCLAAAAMAQTGATPPQPPNAALPDLLTSNAIATCVDCDKPFDFPTHRELLESLVGNQFVGELRRALYTQDILHQFESKAHFDNCHFEGAEAYLASLINEAGQEADAALVAKNNAHDADSVAAAKRAFFALGQALHAVQDFYAHSNYIELQVSKVTNPDDIVVIAPWRKADQDTIATLKTQGLVSGYVSWGFPKDCPTGTISHHDLAKDSAATVSGRRLVPHLTNLSLYRLAVFVARKASLKLMQEAFQRWPVLKEINGPNVAFEVMIDRRGV
jgi:hypothetical protein